MNYFIDVIVPLSIDNNFTYRVNFREFEFLKIGFRVIVPFGKSKFITGLVVNKHNQIPDFYIPKEIEFIIDQESSMNKNQLDFYRWISQYYMCPMGLVLKIGMPKLLLLKSESELVLINKNLDHLELTTKAKDLFKIIALNNKITYKEIISVLKRKNVSKIINELLDHGLIKLKEEVYDYYKPKTTLKILFKNYPANDTEKTKLLDFLNGKKAQQKVVKFLFKVSSDNLPSLKNLLKLTGVSRSTIDSLIKKKILVKKKITINRVQFKFGKKHDIKKLSNDQNIAFKQISSSFKHKNVSLLHGVTSSGKTEIYVKLINEFLKKNLQVLYLVPEIALTTQLLSRLKKYFGDTLAVYHSKFSIEQRTEIWKKVIKNDDKARIIVGTRSSIFLPFKDLGLIVVDEEHESAYKQFNTSPRYHARDSAIFLASIHRAKTLLGSATPSVESYYNALTNKYGFIELKKRYRNLSLPKIILDDLKKSVLNKKMNRNFSKLLTNNIRKNIENKEQVIIFQNRRGHSPYLECSSCGYVYQCINCDVSLTYHQVTNQLKCHHCGFKKENVVKCKKCGNDNILKRGVGTQQVEEDIENLFPEIVVKRMDYDSTRKKNSFQELISAFEQNKFEILVGTQMLTKGLDFKNVTLVGVINADSLIYFPNFRSQEKCFQLLQQVAGRAGRVKEASRVIIQTYNPKHNLFNKIIKNDYVGMFNEQLNQRFTFNYPPYTRLIKIILKNRDLMKLIKSANWLHEALKNKFQNHLLGPESPLIPRLKNKHIKEILIKIPQKNNLTKDKIFISKTLKKFQSVSFFKSIDVLIDVDPYN